jgi:PII-like signaling protein
VSGANEILTLTAYFAERERSQGRFLAEALLDLFDDRRIATSVMLRGIASFGPANVMRSDRSLSLSEDPPVTISAVDTAERITALADDVAGLVGRGVITLERSHAVPGVPTDGHDAVALSLHVGRRHRMEGAPGYVAVCDVLHRRGFAGADVYLGVDGTVDGVRRRATFFSRNGDVPLSIAGIGTRHDASAAIAELRSMLPDALFTIRPVTVCKDRGHALGDPTSERAPFQKLVVRTSEASRHHGRPIHRALIQRLKDSGHVSGATVLRAIWGFRDTGRPQGDRPLQLVRHVPVTTVVLDTASNIAAAYPVIDELTEHEGLVTVEPLQGMLETHAGRRLGTLDLGAGPRP